MTRRDLWGPWWVVSSWVLLTLGFQGCAQAPGELRQTAYLKASNPGTYDHFGEGGSLDGHSGNSVSISADGSTLAVGAQHESSSARGTNGNEEDEAAYNAGAVYVFTRAGADWSQQAYVKPAVASSGAHFGNAVALSADGNTMAVAAFWDSSAATGVNGDPNDQSIPQAGAVYVFARNGGAWTQQAYLKASNTGEKGQGDVPGDGDQYGFSVALSGDGNTVAVGAMTEDSNSSAVNGNQADNSAISAGAVYVYARTGTAWAQQAYIKAPTPAQFTNGDLFGYSVSLNADGSTLAVGAYDEGGSSRQVNGPIDGMRNGSGAVHVFTRTAGAWAHQAYLKVAQAEQGDSWGVAVALSDDGHTLVTSSADEDCAAAGVNPPGCDADRTTNSSIGAAAVFVRNGTTWTQQALLKASNPDIEDSFGTRLALSGDGATLAVGAQNEDSATQGINARQDDNSALEAGAVYLFTRNGNAWTQRAYIKASNNEAFDEFGGSLAVNRDGRMMVVGARGEDSSARGVNGNQADNTLDESGAIYVFAR